MRNQALTGYLLHHKPYQEKRALCYIFSKEFGVIHGISRKGIPLFECLQLFATGKKSLKTFSQVQVASTNTPIRGSQQYAALYLNEVLHRLLPVEDPMPELWVQYDASITLLREPLNSDELRLCLRAFEHSLFTALGYEILLTHDSESQVIKAGRVYRYVADSGFEVVSKASEPSSKTNQILAHSAIFSGDEILQMQQSGITMDSIALWSRLYRYLIDHLLDHKPLHSRLLWQQQHRYQ